MCVRNWSNQRMFAALDTLTLSVIQPRSISIPNVRWTQCPICFHLYFFSAPCFYNESLDSIVFGQLNWSFGSIQIWKMLDKLETNLLIEMCLRTLYDIVIARFLFSQDVRTLRALQLIRCVPFLLCRTSDAPKQRWDIASKRFVSPDDWQCALVPHG